MNLNRKDKAHSFIGYLKGCLSVVRKENNKELEVLFETIINKFYEFYPKDITPVIEIVSGWKGTGTTEVWKGIDNNFLIKQYIKDKNSGDVDEVTTEVNKEDLNRMIFIVRNLPLKEPTKCYKIAELLGYKDWKDLWRTRKDYFRIYYHPVKVLEALKLINYSGRGTITRLL